MLTSVTADYRNLQIPNTGNWRWHSTTNHSVEPPWTSAVDSYLCVYEGCTVLQSWTTSTDTLINTVRTQPHHHSKCHILPPNIKPATKHSLAISFFSLHKGKINKIRPPSNLLIFGFFPLHRKMHEIHRSWPTYIIDKQHTHPPPRCC